MEQRTLIWSFRSAFGSRADRKSDSAVPYPHLTRHALRANQNLMQQPEPDQEEGQGRDVVCAAWARRMGATLGDAKLCDVVFVVGDERIPALRHLCAAHSCVLDMMFGEGWRERCVPSLHCNCNCKRMALLSSAVAHGVCSRSGSDANCALY